MRRIAERPHDRADGFVFCAAGECDVVYANPSTGELLRTTDLRTVVFQKSADPHRPVCYCFNHTVSEVARDALQSGRSTIAEEITAACRQRLDRCAETNPQGTCCLGNVRGVAKVAQHVRKDRCCGGEGEQVS